MGILSFVLSGVSFLLLLFALHLFWAPKGNRLLNRILALILFARFGQILIFLLIHSDRLDYFPFFQTLFAPLYFLAPACFYLYIKGFVNNQKQLKQHDWLHFIPFLLAVIHVFPWPFASIVDWETVARQIFENRNLYITVDMGLFPPYFYYVGQPLLVAAYLLAAWILMLKSFIPGRTWDMNTKWIIFYLSTASFFKVVSLVQLSFVLFKLPMASQPWFVVLNCSGLIFMMVFVLHQPQLLYGYVFVSVEWNEEKEDQTEGAIESSDTELPKLSAPTKSILAPHHTSAYAESMVEFMETEKPFLSPEFQIIHLAQKLDLPVHHCSYVVNKVIGRNFRDWINSYRIKYFIAQYPIFSETKTIEAIANDSGFKSLATFYNAFKKENGQMPRAYFQEKEGLTRDFS